MKFRTEITVPKEENIINYDSSIVMLGSCFTENIQRHFNYYQFKNIANPHGILFHPIAIENAITDCVINREYTQKDLYYFKKRWLSFNHHTKFTSENKIQILKDINTQIRQTNLALKQASHVFITLGSAWIYCFEESGKMVANCHKIPQKKFIKDLLSIDQIVESLENSIRRIKLINSDAIILFTVSPVRHLKDGFVENNLSKAHLISAIHQIINHKQTFYFPSYEIMMDDLRDYRFYKSNLLHPNEFAMEYIWNKFKNSWIADKTFKIMDEVDSIQKSLQHKPFAVTSKEHQEFLKKIDSKIKTIQTNFPHFKFSL